jgi:hypothetical protein
MEYSYIRFMLLAAVLLLALLISGCATGEPAASTLSANAAQPAQPAGEISPAAAHSPAPEPTLTPSLTPGFDLQQLGNMAYQLDIVDQALPDSDGSITLSEGHFERPYPDSASGVVVDLVDHALGDLNADGIEDAVALLAINTGGSGTFINLAAVIQETGVVSHTATLFLGDRVRVESLNIEDGALEVQMIAHASDDPQCCPSQQVTQTYTLQGDLLVTPGQSQVLPLAETAIQALKTRDIAELASLVHPEVGLRFSPYAYVRSEHQVFSPDQLSGLMDDAIIYTWGAFDGSGEPIQMTFAGYFDRFVYSKDFASAEQVSLDRRLGAGNTLDNSGEFYPQSVVVEYHLPGENPEYGGLDWQSLRLVFQQQDGAWHLVGIIHDEWTI